MVSVAFALALVPNAKLSAPATLDKLPIDIDLAPPVPTLALSPTTIELAA